MEISSDDIIQHLCDVFYSIQGEGRFMGLPTLFFRFNKCNLNCKYCDTDFKSNIDVDVKSFLDKLRLFIENYPIKQVCFTGGEPLYFVDDIIQIIKILHGAMDFYRFNVKIETNGTINPIHIFKSHVTYFTVTPKLEYKKLYDDSMPYWINRPKLVSYKFMIDPYNIDFPIELHKIHKFISKFNLNLLSSPIYLSPINKNNEPDIIIETYKELIREVNRYKNNRFFLFNFTGITIQLHKLMDFK